MNAEITLDFTIIKEQLAGYALSEGARSRLVALTPSMKEGLCYSQLEETTRARRALDEYGTPPLTAMPEIEKIIALSEVGSMLIPSQLLAIAGFLTACQRMEAYLKRAGSSDEVMASYAAALQGAAGLQNDITDAIRGDQVQDKASPWLYDVRREIERLEEKVQQKLINMLRGHKELYSDSYPVQRNGRYTLPVKREMKSRVPGTVVDYSGSGGTCFIEPAAISDLTEEILSLKVAEENEVLRILYALTDEVAQHAELLRSNQRIMEDLDFIFAKGKLSQAMKATCPEIGLERRIIIRQGRHPLIDRERCVPLDLTMGAGTGEDGSDVIGVTITGPNTGGKTVALKTVGLLCMMAQCGLHVPAAEGTYLCMNSQYLCDIGDGQSISENLSTFSAHMTNVREVLDKVNNQSLVLLDELGSGTDPAEGMGLAIAILEELRYRDCLFLVTTHYPEVKTFAEHTTGVVNARMAFDRESLQPLYKLEMGLAGESCALHIAKRLGFSQDLLDRAREAAYGAMQELQSGAMGNGDENSSSPKTVGKAEKPSGLAAGGPKKRDDRTKAPARGPKVERIEASRRHKAKFSVGDSVTVYPQKEVGIVFQPEDEEGRMIVQIKGRKRNVSYKRVKLLAPASELYPADYDFSIVFDSVATRKARHQMSKHHVEGLVIREEADDGQGANPFEKK